MTTFIYVFEDGESMDGIKSSGPRDKKGFWGKGEKTSRSLLTGLSSLILVCVCVCVCVCVGGGGGGGVCDTLRSCWEEAEQQNTPSAVCLTKTTDQNKTIQKNRKTQETEAENVWESKHGSSLLL